MYEDPFTENSDGTAGISDEVLYGMPVKVLEEKGAYAKVHTFYHYEGYVKMTELLEIERTLGNQMVVNCQSVDILSIPQVQGKPLITLTRGCLIEFLEYNEEQGAYCKVRLLDGREGYIAKKYLNEKEFIMDFTTYEASGFSKTLQESLVQAYGGDEAKYRQAIIDTAKTYMGTQYRWGGKTPNGIDCSGLVSMSYMLHGVLIYRDAKLMEGFPVREIQRQEMKPADLLYFEGHIALYMGDDYYIHSTGSKGTMGVAINSFNPENQVYRKDLDAGLLKVGTVF